MNHSVEHVLTLLVQAYGESVYTALDPSHTTPSPLQSQSETTWMKSTNTVGVNVRTIGSFWNLIPYALTLPKAQNAIHILPIWEPGVVASLYGMSSWQINPAFFSTALQKTIPQLDTVEKQLKAVVNLLHLLGKAVGMDVVPHTDRYAEQVIANPAKFEWLQRQDDRIVRHEADLYQSAEQLVFEALQQMGCAKQDWQPPTSARSFFTEWSEPARCAALFGDPHDYQGRLQRRKIIIQWLYDHGFETVPATMAPPYRGIEVDPNPDASVYDEEGRLWRDYRIANPRPMSRVFGPLARYRLYESKNNNQNWELDFDRPVYDTWSYVCEHYASIAHHFHFDFMRGDMSHVQMRPGGVPAHTDEYYDLLGAVKQQVLKTKPWFGYFAESFMAQPGEMAFGDESDHLEASFADSTLGDLQSEPVGTAFFVKELARYVHVLETRRFAPNFTILTADKDDPRFDQFYLKGNEVRHFIALFLPIMPSYMALGFECRDIHEQPAPNEHYTKLYVFQLNDGPKATRKPYQWGQNLALFQRLVAQRKLSNEIGDQIEGAPFEWLAKPDPSGESKLIVWQVGGFVFAANLDTNSETIYSDTHGLVAKSHIIFSTMGDFPPQSETKNGKLRLRQGECLVLRIG